MRTLRSLHAPYAYIYSLEDAYLSGLVSGVAQYELRCSGRLRSSRASLTYNRPRKQKMAPPDESQPRPEQLADLSRLADGTLNPRRRPGVESLISASPELSALYGRERGVAELLHRTRAVDRAPARLRARIEAQRPSKTALVRRRASYVGALAAALAAAALVLALVLPGGTPGSPSVSQAAALALRRVSQPAPAPDPSDPAAKLAQHVQGLYFPNWSRTLGWQAAGQRSDRLGGRPAATVYYGWRGRRIAYTIVGVPVLSEPAAPVTHLSGYALRTLRRSDRTIVTWRRAGHTCVLSASGVPAAVLRQLAVWKAPGVRG
jgi:hypothetical protein